MRAPRRNPTLFPYTTLFRSPVVARCALLAAAPVPFQRRRDGPGLDRRAGAGAVAQAARGGLRVRGVHAGRHHLAGTLDEDRKSTRLNSSHVASSYAVFCLKKKNTIT